MSNKVRSIQELLSIFADNNSNQITAQDLRDFVVTVEDLNKQTSFNGSITSNNAIITGGSATGLSFLESSYINSSFINTGLILESNTFSTSKICIRSPITDFTQNNSIDIFSTPDDYMFLFDSLEVVTISSVGINTTLKIKVGDDNNSSEFLNDSLIQTSSSGDRHIVDVAHNAVLPSRTLNFEITHPSSATFHNGFVAINGSLIKTN